MKKTVTMPELKKGMKTAVLCRWCVEPGQTVEKGEEVFETETEKAVSAVEAEEWRTRPRGPRRSRKRAAWA